MKISFVIPAYNEEAYIGACLDSILEQASTIPRDVEVEIVAVNNASKDGTANILKTYSDRYSIVHVVNEPRKGLLFARQAGFEKAGGEIIAQVDADSRLTPNWINKVVSAFKRDDKLVSISGPYDYYDLPALDRFASKVFSYPTYLAYLVNRLLGTGSVIIGGNCALRKSALEKIGGYNVSIAFYGEDTDLACRISNVGKTIFTLDLPMFSSGRRLAKEGTIATGIKYILNYLWVTVFGTPYDYQYSDIRP